MNQKLKDYLRKFSPATADQTMLDDLRQEMEKGRPGNHRQHQTAGGTGCRITNYRIKAVSVQQRKAGLGIR